MESGVVIKEPHTTERRRAHRPEAARVEAARDKLVSQGKTSRDWAIEKGYDPELVYKVLSGRRSCTRGASHKIAVALGIKDGTA
jgi:gp16 family phage-associated protein